MQPSTATNQAQTGLGGPSRVCCGCRSGIARLSDLGGFRSLWVGKFLPPRQLQQALGQGSFQLPHGPAREGQFLLATRTTDEFTLKPEFCDAIGSLVSQLSSLKCVFAGCQNLLFQAHGKITFSAVKAHQQILRLADFCLALSTAEQDGVIFSPRGAPFISETIYSFGLRGWSHRGSALVLQTAITSRITPGVLGCLIWAWASSP